MDPRAKSLGTPDEVFRFPGVEQDAVFLGDLTVARVTAQPGWRWSKDMQPLVGGEWCQARHVGTIVSDEFVFMLPDGTRTELHPGDVYDIRPVTTASRSAMSRARSSSGLVFE